MVLSWILKKPLDEFEDYDDDEEEFDLKSDEELLHGPPSAQGGFSYNFFLLVNAKIYSFLFIYLFSFIYIFRFIARHTSLLVFLIRDSAHIFVLQSPLIHYTIFYASF